MKLLLQDNVIIKFSNYNRGKFVVGVRFIKILKNKIYKYMSSMSKNRHINKLDDFVNQYKNTYHSAIIRQIHILTLELKIIMKLSST